MAALWTLLLVLVGPASAGPPEGTLIWTGIDYGLVRCVGTLDFREPDEIFPGYFDKWNGLFIEEYVDDLQKRMRVAQVVPALSHLAALHEAADPKTQIVRDDSFSFTDSLDSEAIRERVESYDLSVESGTAFTLIADQLHKPSALGCFWAVTYDVKSRNVFTMTRECEAARGIGFRNYWFGSVKAVIDHLPKGGG